MSYRVMAVGRLALDEWTAVTKDGHRSAQFEHTLLVTPDSAEILTQTPTGETAHDSTAAQVNT